MAILVSNERYKGSLGGLVFYQLNGKTVARRKREKMTAREKKKLAGTWQGRAGKSNAMGSKFGRALREIKAYKYQADMYYHSAMTGYITNKVMVPTPEKGGIGTRTILAENVHRISSFTANSEIPKKVLQSLRKTRFIHGDDGISAVVPELPVELLTGSKADHYRVWVNLKFINIKGMHSGWSRKTYSEPIVFGDKVSQTISFNPPTAREDEVLMAIVGVQSLVDGKMVQDVKMNGFVYLVVDDALSGNTQSEIVNSHPLVDASAPGSSGQDLQPSSPGDLSSIDAAPEDSGQDLQVPVVSNHPSIDAPVRQPEVSSPDPQLAMTSFRSERASPSPHPS